MSIFNKKSPDENQATPIHIDRAARVPLSKLQKIVFTLSKLKKDISLFNISTGGLGLDKREVPEELTRVGKTLEGEVKFDGKPFKSNLMVRHLSGDIVGCSFEDNQQELEFQVKKYLAYEFQSLKLGKVDPKHMNAVDGQQPIWLTDSQNNEIYVLGDENHIAHFHMSFMGMYVEGGDLTGIRSGIIVESGDDKVGELAHKGSNLIKMFDHVDTRLVPLALRFCNVAPDISPEIKNKILALLIKTIAI